MRPRKCRNINHQPKARFYKPQGIPLRELEVVNLLPEEVEAMRLKNNQKLSQTEAAAEMRVSQSTFQRILTGAYQKVSLAIAEGKAIKIIDSDPS